MKKILFVVAAFTMIHGAMAQTTSDAQITQEQVLNQVRDNRSYCIYENKIYSLGAKHDGQVCVTNKGAFGNENNPPQWVSSQQAARGNY
jgi:hypothetical protein